jgi:hypothetical protein
VPLLVGLDILVERLPFDPFPYRDLGLASLAAPRPQIEGSFRQGARQLANVEWRLGTVQSMLPGDDGESVVGVKLKTAAGPVENIADDLVVDASAQGELTLA